MNQNPIAETQPTILPDKSESKPINQTTQVVPEALNPEPNSKSNNWVRILTFVIIGLVVIFGAVYFGVLIGEKQNPENLPVAVQPQDNPDVEESPAANPTTQPTTVASNDSTTLPTATPKADPTENWETYTNTEYDYTIKYPATFKTQAGSTGAGILEAPSNTRNLFIYNPSEELSYKNRYIEIENIQLEPTYNSEWIRTTVTLASKDAVKLVDSSKSSNFDIYIVPLKNDQDLIQIYVTNDKDKQIIANQILSTLKFVQK